MADSLTKQSNDNSETKEEIILFKENYNSHNNPHKKSFNYCPKTTIDPLFTDLRKSLNDCGKIFKKISKCKN